MEKRGEQSLTERELWTLKEFVENTLRKSGAILMEMYGRGKRQLKFDDELVTEAENAAWELISEKIRVSFEGHTFLRELSEDQLTDEDAPRFIWIVDTLDGAASFQAGMPVWGISAALFEKFWPVLGFLYLPVTDELYSAYAGRQALLNDKLIGVREDPTVDNESLVLVYSRFHNDFTSTFPGKIRNFGSSAGHMAYVARGAADACLIKNVTVRDMAAGSIILEAAGGELRFFDGSPFHMAEYLDGKRVDEPLIAAPRGAFKSFLKYFKRT
ncbi:MAG TPA: inositol monophosphatase family protein [Desulfomonilaceae bacterium]|nr:inositol monophosphatase family protein [Desulfomonilaceae bacterium]